MSRSLPILLPLLLAACEYRHELDVVSTDVSASFTCEHDSHLRTCVDYELVVDMHNGARSAAVDALEGVSLWSLARETDDVFSVTYDLDCPDRPWAVPAGESTGPIPLHFRFSRSASTYLLTIPCDGEPLTVAPRDLAYELSPRAGDYVTVQLWGAMGSTTAPEFVATATTPL